MRLGSLSAGVAIAAGLACDPEPTAVRPGDSEGSTGPGFGTTTTALTEASSDPTSGEPSASGEPTDTGEPACREPLSWCDDHCVDPRHDPAYCGDCQTACAEAEFCIEGICTFVCGPGTRACDDRCVDVMVDPAHCGDCEQACPEGAACVEGECALACDDDLVQCDDECVDTTNDERFCGGCYSACDEGTFCVFSQCVQADLHHIMVTGQSLSIGQQSGVVSTSQPFENLMFAGGVRVQADDVADFEPLLEQQTSIFGETVASGLANALTALTSTKTFDGARVLMSAHGVSSASYLELSRGSGPYVRGMGHATAGAELAAEAGDAYAVRAIVAIHGEADHVDGNEAYDENLVQWQADYEDDIALLVGQPYPVPLFICQMSSWTHYDAATSAIPAAQLAASRAAPDRVFVVAPKYFLPYVDGLHLTGDGERQLGEYYAKAIHTVLFEGERWVPLSPRAIQRQGRFIDVDFHVPAPPLVFDEVAVVNPGHFGFEYTDASAEPPTIESVVLTGATTVRVTLNEVPVGSNRRLRYAYTAEAGAEAGATTGARGNLRDSDDAQSLHGYSLHNWAVHFDEPVP